MSEAPLVPLRKVGEQSNMHRRVDGVKQGSREGRGPLIFFALRRCRAPPCDRRAALDLRVFGALAGVKKEPDSRGNADAASSFTLPSSIWLRPIALWEQEPPRKR